MFEDELHEPGAHWLKAVDAENPDVIVGYAKWQEPKPGTMPETTLAEWPEGADKGLCDETFGAWARWHGTLMGRRGHWCEYYATLEDVWF